MEKKYFLLGNSETYKLIRGFQILLGLACLSIAIFWLLFNLEASSVDRTLWITIIFLSGFGAYQIWAGIGYATRFIDIGEDFIILKKNSIVPPITVSGKEIDKVELFPRSVIFFMKSKRNIVLRFGTTFFEINEKIKDEVLNFAERNKIPIDIIEEKM